MTDDERLQATEALCDWFKSQSINQFDAASIMLKLTGVITGWVALSETDLAKGIKSAATVFDKAARISFEEANK